MSSNRVIELTNSGEARFLGSGTAYVALKGAPATATYTLLLPASSGTYDYFLRRAHGGLAWSSGVANTSLDYAYNEGREITVDEGKVLFDGTAALTEEVAHVRQAADKTGLNVEKLGTGAGTALNVFNKGTGYGAHISQSGNAIAVRIDQSNATKPALSATGGSASFDGNAVVQTSGYFITGNTKGLQILTSDRRLKNAVVRGSDDSLTLGDSTVDAQTDIIGGSTKGILFNLGSTEKARLSSDGYFGIGTNSPTSLLEIQGALGSLTIREPTKTVGRTASVKFATSSGVFSHTNGIGEIKASISGTATLRSNLALLVNTGNKMGAGLFLNYDGRIANVPGSGSSHFYITSTREGNTATFRKTAGDGTSVVYVLNTGTSKAAGLYVDNYVDHAAMYCYQAVDNYGLYIKKEGGAGNTKALLYLNNGTTADSIKDDSGALLASTGVWTDAPCFMALKTDIEAVSTDDTLLAKLSELSLSRYIDKKAKDKGATYKRYGLFLDDLVSKFGFEGNGISGTELASLAIGFAKALNDKVNKLETRLDAIESK